MPSPVDLLAQRARAAGALVLLLAAFSWAALARAEAPVLAIAWVVAVALPLLAYEVWVVDERQPAGLTLDPDDPPLPDPWWEPVVAVAGLLVVGAGLLVRNGALGALGAVVLVVALAGWARRSRRGDRTLDRRSVRAARGLQRGFAVAPALPEPLEAPAVPGGPASTAGAAGAGRAVDDESTVHARVSPIGGGLQRLVVEQQGAVRADLVLRRAAQVARLAGLGIRTD